VVAHICALGSGLPITLQLKHVDLYPDSFENSSKITFTLAEIVQRMQGAMKVASTSSSSSVVASDIKRPRTQSFTSNVYSSNSNQHPPMSDVPVTSPPEVTSDIYASKHGSHYGSCPSVRSRRVPITQNSMEKLKLLRIFPRAGVTSVLKVKGQKRWQLWADRRIWRPTFFQFIQYNHRELAQWLLKWVTASGRKPPNVLSGKGNFGMLGYKMKKSVD